MSNDWTLQDLCSPIWFVFTYVALYKVCMEDYSSVWYKWFMSRAYRVPWGFDSGNYNYIMGINNTLWPPNPPTRTHPTPPTHTWMIPILNDNTYMARDSRVSCQLHPSFIINKHAHSFGISNPKYQCCLNSVIQLLFCYIFSAMYADWDHRHLGREVYY